MFKSHLTHSRDRPIQIAKLYSYTSQPQIHTLGVDDAKSLLSAVSDASTHVNLSSYIVNGFCKVRQLANSESKTNVNITAQHQ